MNETPGFIGLGSMGQPMAESLLKAGYGLKVYNRTASKTEQLIAQGAEAVSLPEAVARAEGIVVSMVSDDAALQDSVKHTGFLERLYYYFSTKEALFHQLMEEETQQTILEVTSSVQPLTTLRERLLALWEFLARHEEGVQKHILILLNYYQHRDRYKEAASAILVEADARYHDAITEVLGLHDSHLCFLLHCQIDGLLMLRMLQGTTSPFQEQATLFTDMFMAHIQKQESAAEIPPASSAEIQGENRL